MSMVKSRSFWLCMLFFTRLKVLLEFLLSPITANVNESPGVLIFAMFFAFQRVVVFGSIQVAWTLMAIAPANASPRITTAITDRTKMNRFSLMPAGLSLLKSSPRPIFYTVWRSLLLR